MSRPSRFGLLLAAVVAGCAAERITTASVPGARPPWDASPVQTDSLIYHLRRTPGEFSAYVSAVYRNTTADPVYFARCNPAATGPMFWSRRTGPDSTRSFFTDWGWACVGGVPTGTLMPGDSLIVSVRFGSVDQPMMQPPLQPDELVGDFRVQLLLCVRPEQDSDHCSPSPQAQRSSNAFSVRY
jgi:hypothetical protein